MKKNISLLILLFVVTLAPQRKKIKVWLIGDSTMSIKDVKAYPETGWGMPFAHFFDSTVTVDNRARNGRSTKTFIAEGLWKPVFDNLAEGDYVFIQFGHNDEVKEKASFTTPVEFKANLTRYVNESRSKKALPILMTPVSRRSFDSSGVLVESHPLYADLVKDVAREQKVILFDINEKSRALYQQYGPENSKFLFNYLEPNEHPNYPAGKKDNTHFNELGARKIAELVLREIKNSKLDLAERIVKQ